MEKHGLLLAPLVLEKEGGRVPKRKSFAHGSGQGAAIGISQNLLGALAVMKYSQCQALPKALG